MSKCCRICGEPTIFFIWSTSRRFNRRKFIDTLKDIEKRDKVSISVDGDPVCFHCTDKYGLII